MQDGAGATGRADATGRGTTGGGPRPTGDHVAVRCAGTAREVEELASRLRRLPPPSWTGPAATAFEQGLHRPVRGLGAAAEGLRRADLAARRLGGR